MTGGVGRARIDDAIGIMVRQPKISKFDGGAATMNQSDSNFAIWRNVLAGSNTISINEDEYNEIAHSAHILFEMTKFEEKFYIVCEDYRQFEKLIFDINIDQMLYMSGERFNITLRGTEMSRFILSFLSSTKLYLDSIVRHSKNILGNDGNCNEIKMISADLYDNSFEYRVVEFIRNHTKHYDLSVKSASYGLSWDEGKLQCSFKSDFMFDIFQLGGDSSGKKATEKEIIENGGKVSLKKSIRSYFGSMCNMHTLLREKFAAKKFNSFSTIDRFQKMWIEKNQNDCSLTGVVAGYLRNNLEDTNFKTVCIDSKIEIYTDSFFKMTENLKNMDKRIVKW